MRNLVIVLISAFLLTGFNAANAQCCSNAAKSNKTDKTVGQNAKSFEVLGSCGMCKARIEKAATSVKGVNSAVWNSESKILKVDIGKDININEVHKAIAKAGHDTKMHKADNSVYNKLPMCCQYARK